MHVVLVSLDDIDDSVWHMLPNVTYSLRTGSDVLYLPTKQPKLILCLYGAAVNYKVLLVLALEPVLN
jgi:hypothetical protein